MQKLVRPAVSLFVVLSAITGLVYPLLVTAIGRAAFPDAVAGSLVVLDGKPIGSRLIGQNFTSPGYFWGRPSATSPVPYDAASSGGSNLGPTNPALLAAVKQRIAALQAADPGNPAPIPAELVTASASGLDPELSPAAAYYQVPRIAKARGLPAERVTALVRARIEPRLFGIFGEPRVNVLALNLALDAAR